MPKKRGDRAHRTAEKRARRERRQLAREEKFREDHARLVAERSHDPRFIQRIHRNDGTTVYQWAPDSPLDNYLREMMQHQAERFRAKFGRDPGPRTRSSLTPTLTNHAPSIPRLRLAR
jgi:ribosomal protein L18